MRYREVVVAPVWLLALVYFFALSLALAVWAALGNGPGLAVLVTLTFLTILARNKTKLIIEITGNELRVGEARIEIKYLGNAENLDAQKMQLARGREANPLAYLAIRFWCAKGVKVNLNDARDPTPYWLITSNRGDELTTLLKSD